MLELDSWLFPVFDRLRKQGVPLGVSDYLLAIETVRSGVALTNAETFKQLCSLLWAKSREDQELFDLAFAELVEPQLYQESSLQKTIPAPANKTSPSTNPAYSTDLDKFPPELEPEPESEIRQKKVALHPQSLSQPLSLKTNLTDEPHYYQLTPRLPISPREMTAAWRQLRRPQRAGPPQDLDVEGTIKSICSSGLWLSPVLQPRRRNQARLVLLVDQQGSMAAFSGLIQAVIESILKGGLLGKVSFYYFHDCPEKLLYQHPSLSKATSLENVLDAQAKSNSVLILSDAGAARGNYEQKRVAQTSDFLKTLRNYTYLYAWLNPMPEKRWVSTTAEEIARLVPMFPLTREGLNDAVNILRGHPFPVGVGLDE